MGLDRLGLRRLIQYELAYGDRRAMAEQVSGEDLDEIVVRRLLKRWSIPLVKRPGLDKDWLDVACNALTYMRSVKPYSLDGLAR